MKEELARLKAALYYALLNVKPEETTDSEARICFELARDPDIQAILRKASAEAEVRRVGFVAGLEALQRRTGIEG